MNEDLVFLTETLHAEGLGSCDIQKRKQTDYYFRNVVVWDSLPPNTHNYTDLKDEKKSENSYSNSKKMNFPVPEQKTQMKTLSELQTEFQDIPS